MSALPASDAYGFATVPTGSHALILAQVRTGMRVLDVGCNKGYLCRELSKRGCSVAGLEADPHAASTARLFCKEVIEADLERIDELPFPKKSFDAIICADVLEHLADPARALRLLSHYCADKGVVIASVPNVARIDIRLQLLRGKFEYAECGIMDRTHLRFFTRASACALFERSGFGVMRIQGTGLAARIKIFQTLLAFQFVLTAQPMINQKI